MKALTDFEIRVRLEDVDDPEPWTAVVYRINTKYWLQLDIGHWFSGASAEQALARALASLTTKLNQSQK